MARKRMIDPEFWSDEEIGQWSLGARLFYIGLWNFSDDAGRFKAHNNLLKSQLFPYDDNIDIAALKKELGSKIEWYEVDGLQYGYIHNFLKHQRIDKPQPSKLPSPRTFGEDSGRIPGTFGESSATVQEPVPPKLREEKLREVKLSKDKGYVDFEKSTHELWNVFCEKHPTISKIKVITETRRARLKKRYEQETFREFAKVLEAIEQQPFLINGNAKSKEHANWRVNFDWLITNDTNHVKVIERTYKKSCPSGIDQYIRE